MRATTPVMLLALLVSPGTGCVSFDYPEGVYTCTEGVESTCPSSMECRYSVGTDDYRCFRHDTSPCASGTCTGCCGGSGEVVSCLPGDNNTACGAAGDFCLACEPGASCSSGSCVGGSCTAGESWCNSTCVDIYSNAAHCGRCSNACEAPTLFCASGVCVE